MNTITVFQAGMTSTPIIMPEGSKVSDLRSKLNKAASDTVSCGAAQVNDNTKSDDVAVYRCSKTHTVN